VLDTAVSAVPWIRGSLGCALVGPRCRAGSLPMAWISADEPLGKHLTWVGARVRPGCTAGRPARIPLAVLSSFLTGHRPRTHSRRVRSAAVGNWDSGNLCRVKRTHPPCPLLGRLMLGVVQQDFK
jgi:hypothetical protein